MRGRSGYQGNEVGYKDLGWFREKGDFLGNDVIVLGEFIQRVGWRREEDPGINELQNWIYFKFSSIE